MKLTTNLAELCALPVSDLFGELPSRIFVFLMRNGRSTTQDIRAHITLPQSHVYSALVVLVQQNLLYHHTDRDRSITYYEANPRAAYNLIRTGKVVDAVAREYGDAEAELVQTLAVVGSARLVDLEKAFTARHHDSPLSRKSQTNGGTNENSSLATGMNDGTSRQQAAERLNSSVVQLLRSGLLEICSPVTFDSPTDIQEAAYREIIQTNFGGNAPKGARGQDQYTALLRNKLLEVRSQPSILKDQLLRKLDEAMLGISVQKKRKLATGASAISFVSCADVDPGATVRINFEKADVILRNQALVKYATGFFGRVTGQVYAAALRISGNHIERCHPDPLLDLTVVDKCGNEQAKMLRDIEVPPVTTDEILAELPDDLDVAQGIGKPKGKVDTRRADQVRPNPPPPRLPFIDGDDEPASADDDVDYEDYASSDEERGDEVKIAADVENPGLNGAKHSKNPVADDDQLAEDRRLAFVRQHLLILAESPQRFVRHCGIAEGGEWVVDYKQLVTKLRKFEVDSFIEDKFTHYGRQLADILRDKGKLDEKSLMAMANMRKADALPLLHRMSTSGMIEIQEVPKDNTRQAIRTIFLWYFEDDKAHAELLDQSYMSMARCHQVLDARRHQDQEVLELFERSDVKGREEERLHKDTIIKYGNHLDASNRLLNQAMRVDEVVALLRDF